MKTPGLIGGTSYISTIDYYRQINQKINLRIGGNYAARLILHSLNIAETTKRVKEAGWEVFADDIIKIANNLKLCGADCIVLCANTLHLTVGKLMQHCDLPLIHIAREVAGVIALDHIGKVGLLGTRYTMEAPFYKDILQEFGIQSIIPDEEDMNFLNTAIYNELAVGNFNPVTVSGIRRIGEGLLDQGAEGLILGCTELPLIINKEDLQTHLYDTLEIHTDAVVRFALSED